LADNLVPLLWTVTPLFTASLTTALLNINMGTTATINSVFLATRKSMGNRMIGA
jgi:hypothetical protein